MPLFKDKKRQFKARVKSIYPKMVRMTGKFCTYGRVRSNRGISECNKNDTMYIVPMERNQNNNWKA